MFWQIAKDIVWVIGVAAAVGAVLALGVIAIVFCFQAMGYEPD
jgi:hypothetical protein